MPSKKPINIFRIFEKLLKEYINDLTSNGYVIDFESNDSFAKYAKYIYDQMSDYEKSKISLSDYNKKGYLFNYVLTKYVVLRTDSPRYKEYVKDLFGNLFTVDKWWMLKENVLYILNHKYYKRNRKNVVYIVNKIIHRNRVYVLFPTLSTEAIIKLNKTNIVKIYQEVKKWTDKRDELSEFEINLEGEQTYNFSYLLNIYNTEYDDKLAIRIEFDASQYKDEMFDDLSKNWLLLYEFDPLELDDEQNKIEKEIKQLLREDYEKELEELRSRIKYYLKRLSFLNFKKYASLKLNNRKQANDVFKEMMKIYYKLAILKQEYKKMLRLTLNKYQK